MQSVLEQIGAKIDAGPSGVGRYRVRLEHPIASNAELDALIAKLGKDPRVRFAARALTERGRSVIRRALALCFALLLAACAGAGPSKNDASTNTSAGAAREILLTVRQPDSLAIGLTGAPISAMRNGATVRRRRSNGS